MEHQDALIHRDLESLKEGKVVAIVPQGISMLPFIKGGACRVYLLKKEKVEVGDIVLAPRSSCGSSDVTTSVMRGAVFS